MRHSHWSDAEIQVVIRSAKTLEDHMADGMGSLRYSRLSSTGRPAAGRPADTTPGIVGGASRIYWPSATNLAEQARATNHGVSLI